MQILKKETKDENRWYVIRTIPRHEKRICAFLTTREIEHYCPKKFQSRQWSDRKKLVEVVLIPTYIFVFAKGSQRNIILEHPSVLHFISFEKKPAVVKSKDIETLKRFLNEYEDYDLDENQQLVKGQEVEVQNGVFLGMKGLIDTIQGKIAFITLPLINKVLRFKIPISNLNKAKK